VVLLLALLVAAMAAAGGFEKYLFNPITRDAVVNLLTPLFIIALFLERGQEVFISAWREPGKRRLESEIESYKKVDPNADTREQDLRLADYRAHTQQVAFLAGLAGGVLVSIAGVRVLYPLVNHDADVAGAQKLVFDTVDIFLTGGLLGGGSEGIHRLVSVITDFLEATRDRIKGQA